MATMSGPDFHDKHPRAHLVIGEYDSAWMINPETEQTRLGLLMRLAKAIDVTGDYTMADKVADGVIQASFATAEDASGFSYAVQARLAPVTRDRHRRPRLLTTGRPTTKLEGRSSSGGSRDRRIGRGLTVPLYGAWSFLQSESALSAVTQADSAEVISINSPSVGLSVE